ncbi:unnamed protein product [Anisakis simplex]|uniref:PKHG1 n=1 Tax=Anisakis simplex TaxID=6269 RepID=A0A0M3J707_ANISI|nr:unnamed protein product [Anisakis simplex]
MDSESDSLVSDIPLPCVSAEPSHERRTTVNRKRSYQRPVPFLYSEGS